MQHGSNSYICVVLAVAAAAAAAAAVAAAATAAAAAVASAAAVEEAIVLSLAVVTMIPSIIASRFHFHRDNLYNYRRRDYHWQHNHAPSTLTIILLPLISSLPVRIGVTQEHPLNTPHYHMMCSVPLIQCCIRLQV